MAAAARPVASCTCSKPERIWARVASRSSERATIRRGWPPRIALNSSLLPPASSVSTTRGSSKSAGTAALYSDPGLRTPRSERALPNSQAPAAPPLDERPGMWQAILAGGSHGISVPVLQDRWSGPGRAGRRRGPRAPPRARPEALGRAELPCERPRARGADARDARPRQGRARSRAQVLEPLRAPAERSEDLGRANAPVLVEVEHLERPLLELEAFHRAAQRDPELLVELVEVREVRAAVQRDLVQTTDPAEPEPKCHGCHPQGWPATFLVVRRVGERLVPGCSGALFRFAGCEDPGRCRVRPCLRSSTIPASCSRSTRAEASSSSTRCGVATPCWTPCGWSRAPTIATPPWPRSA